MSRRALALAALLTLSCDGEPDGGAEDAVALGDPAESPPIVAELQTLSPGRELARRANDSLFNYGSWSASEIELAKRHDVVVLDPMDGVTRAQVAAIQGGLDPADPDARVLVLCYISIGEDIRTADKTDAELAADPRFVGDGSGPRIDPRGVGADGASLSGIDPLGLPSPGGTGFASYYLDDVSVRNDPDHLGDGFPDRNGNFHGAFVNAGDPKWFAALQDMRIDGVDRVAGLREILTTTYGRGLGCDGVFLDTLDTAAPNLWTDASSSNETKYEWTAPGFGLFLQRLRDAYPDVVILQNRGLFFFNPVHPHYEFIPRGLVDFVAYESYRLNSSSSNNPHPYHYADNRYNFAPKIMAEANRPDGFRVLSIGYAEGPASEMDQNTLVGTSTLGTASLLEDIRVAERLAGFRHYLTDSSLTLVNRFVLDRADRSDAEPPVWTSTYNDKNSYPTPPGEPTPRVGLQQVVAGQGSVTARWDVALDLNRVRYALYYKTTPFDFVADPNLTGATRVVLDPRPTTGYADGVGPSVYANEATVGGLTPGAPYYFVLRAFDDSPAQNEEKNQVVLMTGPAPQTSYLGRLRASNGVSDLTYRFQYAGSWTYRRVFIDRDRVTGTGFAYRGIGADHLIEEGKLYRYTGDGVTWAWAAVGGVTFTQGTVDGMRSAQWNLAQSLLGAGFRDTNLVFQLQSGASQNASPIYRHVYTTSSASSPFLNYFAENDASKVYFHAEISGTYGYTHVFIDDDGNKNTGYAFGGIGAGYMIENKKLYKHVGPGWAWSSVATANLVVSGKSHDWWVPRSALGAPSGTPRMDLVFQANGGSPTYVSPPYARPFTP